MHCTVHKLKEKLGLDLKPLHCKPGLLHMLSVVLRAFNLCIFLSIS